MAKTRQSLHKKYKKQSKRSLRDRLRFIEDQIGRWLLEDVKDYKPFDKSHGQVYDEKGELSAINLSSGGSIKKYAHGGSTRKTKLSDY
jgi:hypothetical protein